VRPPIFIVAALCLPACFAPVRAGLEIPEAKAVIIGAYGETGAIEVPSQAAIADATAPINGSIFGKRLWVLAYPWSPAQLGLEPGELTLDAPPCELGERTLPIPDDVLAIDGLDGRVLERSEVTPSALATACIPAISAPACFDHRSFGEPCHTRRLPEDRVWCSFDCEAPAAPEAPSLPDPPQPPMAPELGCDPSTVECAPAIPVCPSPPTQFLGELRCQLEAPSCESHWAPGLPAGTIYVDPSAAAGGDGSLARPYSMVLEALDVAPPGATIALSEGLHVYDQIDRIMRVPDDVTIAGACANGTRIQSAPTLDLGFEATRMQLRDVGFDRQVVFDVEHVEGTRIRVDANGMPRGIWMYRGDATFSDLAVFGAAHNAIEVGPDSQVTIDRMIGSTGQVPADARQLFYVAGALEADWVLGLGPLRTGLMTGPGANVVADHFLLPSVEAAGFWLAPDVVAAVHDAAIVSRDGDAIFVETATLTAERLRVSVDGGLAIRALRAQLTVRDLQLAGSPPEIQIVSSTVTIERMARRGTGIALHLLGRGTANLQDIDLVNLEPCPLLTWGLRVQDYRVTIERAHVAMMTAMYFEEAPSFHPTLIAQDLDYEGDPACTGMVADDVDRQSGIISNVPIDARLERIRLSRFTLPSIELGRAGSNVVIEDFTIHGLEAARKTNITALRIGGNGSRFSIRRGHIDRAFHQLVLARFRADIEIEDLTFDGTHADGIFAGLQVEDDALMTVDRFRLEAPGIGVFLADEQGNGPGRMVLKDGVIGGASTGIDTPEVLLPEQLERVLIERTDCDAIDHGARSDGCPED
jgi:hypothetical protein